jgi:glycine reductase complex component B subunit gamma
VHIAALSRVAERAKANRIVKGKALSNPCGDPALPPEADKAFRRRLVERALQALQTDVAGPTVFEVEM